MTEVTATPASRQPSRQPGRRALAGLASLVISFAAPLVAYNLIRPHAASSAVALVLAGAIPAGYTLAVLAVTRRLDPFGIIGVAGFGLGVLVSWASGGNALAVELEEPLLLGLAGAGFLVSDLIGRPLHLVILRLLGRGDPRYAAIASRAGRRTSMVVTAIIGLTLLAHAVAVAVLAVTQPVSTFVALQRPVGLPVLGLGIAAVYLYRRHLGRPGDEEGGCGSGPAAPRSAAPVFPP